MLKPRSNEERAKRLMGPLLGLFDLLYGKKWVTLVGVVIFIVLVVWSFLPVD